MIDFLAYPFFQRALLAGLLTAVLCGSLSFFVLLRRLAFVGSGVAHAAFGGVAIAVGACLLIFVITASVMSDAAWITLRDQVAATGGLSHFRGGIH